MTHCILQILMMTIIALVNSLVKRTDQPWVFTKPQWSLLFSLGERVMFTQHVKAYFQNTSLHGLQYVGEDGRPFMEKVLWMILFLLGIVLMVIFFIPGIISINLRLWHYYEARNPKVSLCSNEHKSGHQRILNPQHWLPRSHNLSKQQNHEEQLSGSDGLLQAALGKHHERHGQRDRHGVPVLGPRLSRKHGFIFWQSGRGKK